MKLTVCALCILLISVAAAAAEMFPTDSPITRQFMQGYYGNTLICKAENIFECHSWFRPDGTFIQFSGDSRPHAIVDGVDLSGVAGLEGTWWIERDDGQYKLCRRLSAAAEPRCEPAVAHKVGDTWAHSPSPNWPGETFTLIAGHY